MMLDAEHKQAIIPGGNGMFQPTIVRAGRVIATWKRTASKKQLTIDVKPLVALTAADQAGIGRALDPYGRFMGLPAVVRHPARG
jgi:hypothetical protein